MNNEIKEILKNIKKVANRETTSRNALMEMKDIDYQLLLDYITNLQQENLSLAKENEQEKQFIKDCGFENVQQLALDYIGIRQEKEDYKSRIEKAVEYMEENCITSDTWEDLGFCNFVPTGNIKYKSLSAKKVKDVINILNGKE